MRTEAAQPRTACSPPPPRSGGAATRAPPLRQPTATTPLRRAFSLLTLASLAASSLASPLAARQVASCDISESAGPRGDLGTWGGNCESDSDCSSGRCCSSADGSWTGTRCLLWGQSHDCTSDSACGSDFCFAGRCQNPAGIYPVPNGGHCYAEFNCRSRKCQLSDRTCVQGAGAEGAPCNWNEQCASRQCSGGPAWSCLAFTCNADRSCPNGFVCGVDLCVEADLENGESCNFDQQCKSGSCGSNGCTAKTDQQDGDGSGGTDGSTGGSNDGSIDDGSSSGDSGSTTKKSNGQSCSAGSECQSGKCSSGACTSTTSLSGGSSGGGASGGGSSGERDAVTITTATPVTVLQNGSTRTEMVTATVVVQQGDASGLIVRAQLVTLGASLVALALL